MDRFGDQRWKIDQRTSGYDPPDVIHQIWQRKTQRIADNARYTCEQNHKLVSALPTLLLRGTHVYANAADRIATMSHICDANRNDNDMGKCDACDNMHSLFWLSHYTDCVKLCTDWLCVRCYRNYMIQVRAYERELVVVLTPLKYLMFIELVGRDVARYTAELTMIDSRFF